MSTILKALENRKNSPQMRVMEHGADTSWKLIAVAALLLIVILLGAVLFLLLKPTPASISAPLAPLIKAEVVEVPSPVSPRYKIRSEEAQASLVSEVSFNTIPLPLVKQSKEVEQIWVSSDKTGGKQSSSVSNKKLVEQRVAQDKDDLNNIELDSVSKDLQRRFAMAVEYEDKKEIHSFDQQEIPIVGASDISTMPVAFQFLVPDMRYDSHMYSTDVEDRWIRINGVDLHIGDFIGSIELLDIMPQQSLFRLNNQHFTLESLQDWEG